MKRLLLCALISMLAPTMVRAASTEGTEELSYEDLVDRLSSHQRKAVAPIDKSAFDNVQVHAGMGLINSFSTYELGGHSLSRSETGLEISLGVDLFSPQWEAGLAFRNFGLTQSGTEEHTLRELDLKIAYHDQLEGPWEYRVEGGLAQRSLQLSDSASDLNTGGTTPAFLGSLGTRVKLSEYASLGFEVGARLPVIDQTADKGSYDLGLEFKLSL